MAIYTGEQAGPTWCRWSSSLSEASHVDAKGLGVWVLVCVCMCVCVLVCGVCVYVLVCVCWCVWRRRREAAEEAEKPGIQNQKQEPHTKMWGKTLSTSALKLFKTVSTLVETCSLPRTVSKLLSDLSLTQKMVSTNCPFQHRMLLVPLALC